MRRTLLLFAAVAVLLVPAVSAAGNPDGLVGSLMLQPSFRIGPKVSQWALAEQGTSVVRTIADRRTWRASLEALLPVSDHLTLGAEFSSSQDWSAQSDVAPPSGTGDLLLGLNHVVRQDEVTFLARIHLGPHIK